MAKNDPYKSAVLWGPDQLPDGLRGEQQGARRLLLDPLNLPPPHRVPGTILYRGPPIDLYRCVEGTIGCLVDPELLVERHNPSPSYYYNYSAFLSSNTPDTSFYQVSHID